MTNSRKKQVLILTVLVLTLSGCSTYGSSFACGDARGAKCRPMDEIDQLISSGAIETYTKVRDGSKCRGVVCQDTTRLEDVRVLQDVEGIEIVEITESGGSNVSH